MDSVAILICSCSAYAKYAAVTLQAIERYWQPHPPVFIAGISLKNTVAVQVAADTPDSNWIQLAFDACVEVSSLGFEFVYLILDDHPPVLRCNSEALNDQLPGLARTHTLASVRLDGWELKRDPLSKSLSFFCEENALLRGDGKWTVKPCLHPSLWSSQDLIGLLQLIIETYPEASSPWEFEHYSNRLHSPSAEELRTRIAQVSAAADSDKLAIQVAISASNERLTPLEWLRELRRVRFQNRTLERGRKYMCNKLLRLKTFYQPGPYPTFHAGLSYSGSENLTMERFIKRADAGEAPRIVSSE